MPVVPVTYEQVQKFYEKLSSNYSALSDADLTKNLKENKTTAGKEIKLVHLVFDQKALLAGTGLLLKIMRQFESLYEKKQFFLVKNGQVGWISAFVEETRSK